MKFPKYRIRKTYRKVWIYACSSLIVLFTCFPFFWLALSSFRPAKELFAVPPTFFPKGITLANYSDLFSLTPFGTWFKNSCLVSGAVVVVVVILSFLGGYSLSRYNYRGRRVCAHFMMFLPMMPALLIAVPLLMILVRLRLANSHLGLVISFVASLTPFCTWLLWSFFRGIPVDAEEAGRIDGASLLQVLWHIVLPLARPGIIAVAVFSFIASWVNFTKPFILLATESLYTLSIGVGGIYANSIRDFEIGLLVSSCTLATLPGLIIFLWLQKYLVRAWGGWS